MNKEVRHFSLRKLSVGLASVLVGVSIFGASQTVKADTVTNSQALAMTSNVQSADTQENKNGVKSSFSNDDKVDNAKSNLIQTDSLNQNPTNSQEANNSNDLQEKSAEKSIVGSSSTLKINNQSNDHAENNSQTQSQKLDITKISQQLNQKELATNLTQDNSTQKDYTPDINAWTGHDDGTYYILDGYTPKNDAEKDLIVIPNEADFEKAGKSTNGHEVGITRDVMKDITQVKSPKEVHFSETNNKKIKAITNDWDDTFRDTNLKSITGNSFDTSSIISMDQMFLGDSSLSDISALASWNVENVIDMANAFLNCSSLSDLSSLEKWNTKSLQRMGHMFAGNPSLISIEPLKNWNLHNAQYQDNVFAECTNLVNIDAINNWDYSSTVTVPGYGDYPLDNMFYNDHKIQINIGTDSGLADFIRHTGRIDAFHNSSNQISTSNTKLIELLTNTNFQAQNETTTAKRTITFSGLPANRSIPPIVQVISYTKLATAIIDMTGTSDSNAHGKIVSSGFEKDWQLDTSKQNDAIVVNGQIHFKSVKIPHINGYTAHLVRNKINPALFTVSFMAVPSENKPSTPVEVAPSKPSAPTDNTNKPADDLQQRVVTKLNSNDSGWTMPKETTTYTVEIPVDDATIDLSDLVIAEPVHAQTTTQIRVTKRFKLSKKHSIKHLKHRKKAVRTFKKYRL